jgi:hypothetical protein
MTLPDQLQEMASEFRIYARAECLPVERAKWEEWADVCEAAMEASAVPSPSPAFAAGDWADMRSPVTPAERDLLCLLSGPKPRGMSEQQFEDTLYYAAKMIRQYAHDVRKHAAQSKADAAGEASGSAAHAAAAREIQKHTPLAEGMCDYTTEITNILARHFPSNPAEGGGASSDAARTPSQAGDAT